MPRKPMTIEEAEAAFWALVDIRGPDECWLIDTLPYVTNPYYSNDRRAVAVAKTIRERYGVQVASMNSSRFAWIIHHKKVPPEGLQVLHTCHNALCCNPDHLRLGTPSENLTEAYEQNGNTVDRSRKVSIETVRKVRQSILSNAQIAKLLAMSPRTVSDIRTYKTHKEVV